MRVAHVKNWTEFQHYKDRSPPWLKLHRSLLDDYTFQMLPLASKALAPMIWLIAAESKDGVVQVDSDFLAFRLRWSVSDIEDGLTPLIQKGFLICDSGALADCYHDACLEGEGETEGEREKNPPKPPKGGKRGNGKMTLRAYLADCESKGQEPIPETDAVWGYPKTMGIPAEWIPLAWWAYQGRYLAEDGEPARKQASWPQAFRNAVRENWLHLWWTDGGEYRLTTTGVQAQKDMAARAAA